MVKDLKEPLQKLAIAKGQVTATLRIMLELTEMVGETPIGDEDGFSTPHGEENIGEVLYFLSMGLTVVSINLQSTTNYLRKLEGLQPNDYTMSAAQVLQREAIEGAKRIAKEMGVDLPEDGSPV